MLAEVTGYQTPRIHHADFYAETQADKAIGLAVLYDKKPFPWQEFVLRDWLAVDRSGKWVHELCVLDVRRQQGKSLLLIMRVVYGMIVLGERILFTAHRDDTVRELFVELTRIFNPARYPDFASFVKSIKLDAGEIELHNGGHLWIGTRAGFGRGRQAIDLVVIDESQAYTPEQQADIEPTLTMSANPQVIMAGTPPVGTMAGEVLKPIRARALTGKTRGTCFSEWSPEQQPNSKHLDDVEAYRQAAPSMGISNFTLSKMRKEREKYAGNPFIFETECLGIFVESGRHADVVDMSVWGDLADPTHPGPADLASCVIAADMNADRTRASVSIAGLDGEGRSYVELLATTGYVSPTFGTLAGVDWLADVISTVVASHGVRGGVVIDTGNPAQTVADELKPRGIRVTAATFPDVIVGCGRFYDAVMGGSLRHLGDENLTTSLAAARKVPARDGWKLGAKAQGGDITGARSAVLALWGATTAKALRRAYREPRPDRQGSSDRGEARRQAPIFM